MHYSRHRLTALVAYVTTLNYTRQLMINELALLAHWFVRQELNRFSLVQISSVTSLCKHLNNTLLTASALNYRTQRYLM